ncbi:amino acid adenylation domain-containing protein [Kitasatospora sp. MAP5-34]|uniref:amino acid adenylation domain-containing protein n=1 Tax=Kitasatospora sp. MAP5-34 TaxID=3035102 RepID=UPI002473A542|nr:amino acid adenylation domain-containing protein [Kitasatospora sp. MAP5-34]MDH6578648.1 amino acid adenylation domain-containing protein [Kitasatospora sp. MAP5-34]
MISASERSAAPETVRRLLGPGYGADDRPCIDDGAGLVTRAELRSRVLTLAARISDLAGPNALVAVLCHRGRDFVASALAVHHSGGAHLPLDTSHPDERLATVLASAEPDLVLTTSYLLDRLPPGTAALLLDTGEVAGRAATRTTRCDGLAYVTYTSGTTGRPKGVAVTHEGLRGYFQALDHEIGADPDQVWLAASSVTFDSSVGEILWPVVSGHLVRLGGNTFPELVDEVLDPTRRITHMQCAPTLLRLLLSEPGADERLRAAHSLLIGGEAFPLDLVPVLHTGSAGPRLVNVYGPTEATVWVSRCDVAPGAVGPVSVGSPSEGNVLRVLDEQLEPVAPGGIGMLWIGGRQVAAGYWNDPGLTEKSFRPDPFAGGSARMYRTGDLAVLTEDGIVLVGREDDQVKVHGNRVELGEVEKALRAAPGVQDAVCLVDRDTAAASLLVGVCAGDGLDRNAVRAHLAGLLPGYMVPSRIVIRDLLPMTVAGKVDRRQLALDLGV